MISETTMILNKLWDRYQFEPYEKKAANIITGVVLFFVTLGVISAVYPQHAGTIWGTLATVLIGGMFLFLVCVFIYMAWTVLSDYLQSRG